MLRLSVVVCALLAALAFAPARAADANVTLCMSNAGTNYNDMIAGCTAAIPPQTDVDAKATLLSRRGAIYLAIGQYDKAIADQTAAINLNPSTLRAALAYGVRSLTYKIKGDLDRAL